MKNLLVKIGPWWAKLKTAVTGLDHAHRKRIVAAVIAVAVVIGLALMPILAASKDLGDEPVSTLMNYTVTSGNLSAFIHGGGNLAEEGGMTIRLPEGVKLTEFYVPNYAEVKKGDKLAGVDRVTVMQAISKTQESMDQIKQELRGAENGKGTANLTTQTGGLVKAVYAQAGDEVGAVMMQYGALAVLSLDGLMALEVKSETEVAAGSLVTLTFEDGTTAEGKVESALDGTITITVEDKGYPMDAKVSAATLDGVELGDGILQVNSPWRVMGTSGRVSRLDIRENQKVKKNGRLMTLKDVDKSADFIKHSNRHRQYEQLMTELFIMYQNEAIVAPCDGIVTGVDRNSVHLLAAQGGYEITLLANAPDNSTDQYLHYVVKVDKVEKKDEDKNYLWHLTINPQKFAVEDYLDLPRIPNFADVVTATGTYETQPGKLVYEFDREAKVWNIVPPEQIAVDDVLLFAEDSKRDCVWIVRVPKEQVDAPVVPTPTPEVTPNPDELLPGEDFIIDGGFFIGGGGGGGYTPPEPPELFDLEGTDILTVTPQDTMTLTINLKEQDIGKISMGQIAQVKIAVLKGETFEGVVTSIYSKADEQEKLKFYVELTLQRKGSMLSGMSAAATFTGATAEETLLIPVAALQAQGAKTLVFTDVSGGEPTKPVEVTTGLSDGEMVEILEGLSEGQTIYYEYYEAQEVSNAVAGSGNLFW